MKLVHLPELEVCKVCFEKNREFTSNKRKDTTYTHEDDVNVDAGKADGLYLKAGNENS